MATPLYRIGIDAGSKTIKMVVADESGRIVRYFYNRHRANVRRTLLRMLDSFIGRYGNMEGQVCITGSAGISIAKTLGLPFVQEVMATTAAVKAAYPEADAFIELGGEDAKVVYLTGQQDQRMNASCAGGTGGFVDTIAFMLGVHTSEMNQLARRSTHIYPIASRCAVFAQTDVRPLLNAGVSKEDLAASTLEAIVRQTLGGLACGRPLRGTVVFLGGPFEYLSELAVRFRRALGLSTKTGIRPAQAHLFTALGAALCAGTVTQAAHGSNTLSLSKLQALVSASPAPENDLPHLPPLFETDQERARFDARHASCRMPRISVFESKGPLYLGFDAGSTTVKYALLNEEGKLLYFDYRATDGNVLETAMTMLSDLYKLLPSDGSSYIAKSVAIGYGDAMLCNALRIDANMVETLAHLRAAQAFRPDVSFILDIGGQDMKALWVKDGQIVDAVLNEACSSGCGSFVEGTAHSLRMSAQRFSSEAMSAKNPIDLGTKCTVFMTSRVRHAQKIGAELSDIAAGIAYSVVQNALYRVIGHAKAANLGSTVVVQGGTFQSDAVLRAFEKVTGLDVIRPDTAPLMGAIGAALTARDYAEADMPAGKAREDWQPKPSGIVAEEELARMAPSYTGVTCTGCSNSCALSTISFGDGRLFISGNRCSKGEVLAKEALEEARRKAEEQAAIRGIRKKAPTGPASFGGTASFGRGARATLAGGVGGIGSNAPKTGSAAGAMGSAAQHASNPAPAQEHRPAKSTHEGITPVAGVAAGASKLKGPIRIIAPRHGKAPAPTGASNLLAWEWDALSAYSQSTGGRRASMAVGILTDLVGNQVRPYWHAFFSHLGFAVVAPPPVSGFEDAGTCVPVALAKARFAAYGTAGAHAVFIPRFHKGMLCANAQLCTEELCTADADGKTGGTVAVAPILDAVHPGTLAYRSCNVTALEEALRALCPANPPSTMQVIDAMRVAVHAQSDYERSLLRKAVDALNPLNDENPGVVAALRPCCMAPELAQVLSSTLQEEGTPAISAFAFEKIMQFRRHSVNLYDPRPKADAQTDAAWRESELFENMAHFCAKEAALSLLVFDHSSCSYDAAGMNRINQAVKDAGLGPAAIPASALTSPTALKQQIGSLLQKDRLARGKRSTSTEKRGQEASRREPAGTAALREAVPAKTTQIAWSGLGTRLARQPLQGNADAPNVAAAIQRLLAGFASTAPVTRRTTIGLPSTLATYEYLPFWHTFFTHLGFGVAVADHAACRRVRNTAAESIPSESVCECAKITHARLFALREAGAQAVFLPLFERGRRCPVLCGYAGALADSVEFLRDGSLGLLQPHLKSFNPSRIAASPKHLESLCNALRCLEEPSPVSQQQVLDALSAGSHAQQAFINAVCQQTEEALAWVAEQPGRYGAVVAGRPYHLDPALLHGIDREIQKLGLAVIPALGLKDHLEPLKADAEWKANSHLVKLARFTTGTPGLCMVALQSFGCGFDSVNIDLTRDFLLKAGCGFTALKIDEIVDTAHIRIRLRTMAESLASSGAEHPSAKAQRHAEPEAAPGEKPAAALFSRPLGNQTLETARACAPADICFTAAATVAEAINVARSEGGPLRLKAPRICQTCIVNALPLLANRSLGYTPAIEWQEDDYPLLQPPPSAPGEDTAIRVGVVGNPLLCFSAYMNESLGALLESIGAKAVWPNPQNLYVDDVRYLRQLEEFSQQGVHTVLYLQSFGCLKGHVQARGAAHNLAKRFPHMPVVVLDYDPESSALNRENRIRLAVEAARQRARSDSARV